MRDSGFGVPQDLAFTCMASKVVDMLGGPKSLHQAAVHWHSLFLMLRVNVNSETGPLERRMHSVGD